MQWFAQAPSNIALIKYMGKQDVPGNLPINASLSYTLDHLLSSVELQPIAGKKDYWEPLVNPGTNPLFLSTAAQDRYLVHLERVKLFFNYTGAFVVRSSNNFPHSAGLASSASSFAALTKCAMLALTELTDQPIPSIETQAQLSRQGSGSSCRSFFAPWVIWEGARVSSIDLPYAPLIHQAVIITHEEKEISSKEAHQRVRTSPEYPERKARATQRLQELIMALQMRNWDIAYEICWKEFEDMHHLFHTAAPSFTYIGAESKKLLTQLRQLWDKTGDGPIVTMDAGPNIHLLYREDQRELSQKITQDILINHYDFI